MQIKNGGLTAGAELTVICLGVQKREAERPKVEVVQVEEEVVHEDNDWGERHEVTHPAVRMASKLLWIQIEIGFALITDIMTVSRYRTRVRSDRHRVAGCDRHQARSP